MARYRVEVGYGYKKRKGGVAMGDHVEANGEDEAERIATERHIKPYRSRVLHYVVLERLKK